MKWITQAKHATQFAFIENDKKALKEAKKERNFPLASKTYATGPNLNPRITHTHRPAHTQRESEREPASSVAGDETMRH